MPPGKLKGQENTENQTLPGAGASEDITCRNT